MNSSSLYKKTTIVLSIAMVVLLFLMHRKCESDKVHISMYEAAQDSLHVSRNQLNQEEAHTTMLQAHSKKQFLNLKTKDEEILRLQGIIKGYKGRIQSAIYLANNTVSSGATITKVEHDTIYVDSSNGFRYIYPTYSTILDSKWESGFIRATKDSIFREIKIHNEYEITTGDIKTGLFKKNKSQVKIKNLNPNTQTTELKMIDISTPERKWTFGLHATYGLTLPEFEFRPVVGIGVGYQIIGVK